MNITKDEIKKLARMSRIAVTDDEIVRLHSHVTSVLSYATRVQEIARDSAELEFSHDSRLRADKILSYNAQAILAQAPENQENLFVVPKVL
jgi:aspartyl-tRNA(Asn)/glutamyl-tRNA(Gln) amidotransferase subunit C